MKKTLIAALVASVVSSSAFAINTYNVFTDINGSIQFFQPGGSTPITNSYVFEVGSFIAGTDFDSAASIASNFRSFGAPVNWDGELLGPGVGGASLSFSFDELAGYPAGVTVGQTLAIWVYDSKAVEAASDWAVITNSTWLVQPLAAGAAVDSRDYTITDAGTTALFGSIAANKVITEAAVGTVIPEPSSFAAIAGLAVVGMAASRRRRSA